MATQETSQYGPLIPKTDANGYATGGFMANPAYTGPTISPYDRNTGATLSTPSVLSSSSGADQIQKDLSHPVLQPAPVATPTVTPPQTQQQTDLASGKNNPFGYDSKGGAISNPNTGDGNYSADQLTAAGITDPVKEGLVFNPSTNTYSVGPTTTSGAQSNLGLGQQTTQANDTLGMENDWAMGEMKKAITGSDAVLADSINNIMADYANRKAQLEQINNASLAQISTQGYRYGTARYSSSLNTSLISTEERAGIQKLSELAVETQGLVIKAKQAAATQKFDMLNKYLNEVDKKRTEQADAAAKLATAKAAQDKAIQEKMRLSKIDNGVGDALSSGITDPKEILKYIGGDASAKEIADAIGNLTADDPNAKNIFDIQKMAAENGASPDILKAIGMSKDANGAFQAAGTSLAKATGWMGEYQAYARDATARGLTPMTPVEFKNWDDNNKIAIAKAGAASASGLSSPVLTKVLSVAGQFDNEAVVKQYNIIKEGKQFIDNIPDNTQNPADQQGIIYAFAKAMDPNSVVREGEYATVQKYAQSWANTFGFSAERIFSNSPFLTQEAIKNMKKTINSKAAASEQTYKNVYDEYGRRINKVGGITDGKDYITDYSKGYGGTTDTGNHPLIQDEENAKNTLMSYGEVHQDARKQILDLLSQPDPTLGRPLNPSEIMQVLGIQ